jgi:hypothetical protein
VKQLQQSHDLYSPLRAKETGSERESAGSGYWDREWCCLVVMSQQISSLLVGLLVVLMPYRLLCNEKVLSSAQTWLLGFSTIYHYTTFGMASNRFPGIGVKD